MDDQIKERIAELREWANRDQSLTGVRMYDGMMELLGEVLSELRDIKAELHSKSVQSRSASASSCSSRHSPCE